MSSTSRRPASTRALASASMSFMTPVDDSLWVANTAAMSGLLRQVLGHPRRVGALAPVVMVLDDFRAEGPSNFAPAPAEHAPHQDQHFVAGARSCWPPPPPWPPCPNRSAAPRGLRSQTPASAPPSPRGAAGESAGPRWLKIGRAAARVTLGGTGVGPGMRNCLISSCTPRSSHMNPDRRRPGGSRLHIHRAASTVARSTRGRPRPAPRRPHRSQPDLESTASWPADGGPLARWGGFAPAA